MNNTSLIIRLLHLVKNPPIKELTHHFTSLLGICWGVTGFLDFSKLIKFEDSHKQNMFLICVSISAIYCIYKSIPPKRKTRSFPGSTVIKLEVGDILKENSKDNISVLSSQYFDSCTETAISNTSIKGQLIFKYFNSRKSEFDREVLHSLQQQNIKGELAPCKKHGLNCMEKYPVGTFASVNIGSRKALVVVGSKFDDTTTKTTTDSESLWISLLSLWKAARINGQREPLLCPIWGANLGGAPGNRIVLFETLLCSFASAASSDGKPPVKQLTIVIRDKDYDPDEFRSFSKILDQFTL